MNLQAVEGVALLAVPLDQPERVFTAAGLAKEVRLLRQRFHPDRAGGDSTVFDYITKMADSALAKQADGTWCAPGLLQLDTVHGKKFEFRHLAHRSFELGEEYIGNSTVLYMLRTENDDLYRNAQRALTLAVNAKTSDDLKRLLPELTMTFSTATHRVLVFNKKPYLIQLRAVLQHFGGKLEPKHVAWICSRLMHIATHLTRVGVVHGDVSLDSVFIDPQTHYTALLGGWWYTAALGRSLRGYALPARTLALGVATGPRPPAEAGITGECVRATVREALGDILPSRLLADKSIPRPMLNWLQEVAGEDTLHDYSVWYDKVLPAAFGPRKFHKMSVTPEEIYP